MTPVFAAPMVIRVLAATGYQTKSGAKKRSKNQSGCHIVLGDHETSRGRQIWHISAVLLWVDEATCRPAELMGGVVPGRRRDVQPTALPQYLSTLF